jgi:hypothetical protein
MENQIQISIFKNPICISIRLQAYRAEYTSCAERVSKTKKATFSSRFFCGMDGTRTRDPLRDRQVF